MTAKSNMDISVIFCLYKMIIWDAYMIMSLFTTFQPNIQQLLLHKESMNNKDATNLLLEWICYERVTTPYGISIAMPEP